MKSGTFISRFHGVKRNLRIAASGTALVLVLGASPIRCGNSSSDDSGGSDSGSSEETSSCTTSTNEISQTSYDGSEDQASWDKAQSFQVSSDSKLYSIEFNLRGVSGTSSLTYSVYQDNGSGTPDAGTLIASTTVSVSSSFAYYSGDFSTRPTLTAGQTYWIVVTGGGGSFGIKAGTGGYSGGLAKRKNSGWSSNLFGDANYDYVFRVNICGN